MPEILKSDQVGKFGKLKKRVRKLTRKVPKEKSAQKIRAKWVKDVLALWGKIIVYRDKECQWCHGSKCKNYKLGGHHIVARSITKQCLSSWFDPRNGMALGWWCHDNIKHDPDEYIIIRDLFLKKNGLKYNYLKTIYSVKSSIDLSVIKCIYRELWRECIRKKLI